MWGQMASTDGGKKMLQNVDDIREARTHAKDYLPARGAFSSYREE